jgi:hypothetical protein
MLKNSNVYKIFKNNESYVKFVFIKKRHVSESYLDRYRSALMHDPKP